MPFQQGAEIQNVAAHLEDCRNMDESQSTLIDNVSQKVITLDRMNLLYPPGQVGQVRY